MLFTVRIFSMVHLAPLFGLYRCQIIESDHLGPAAAACEQTVALHKPPVMSRCGSAQLL